MFQGDLLSLSGLGLMLALGLRHGLDPDHIAVIDGLTIRALDQRPGMAPWVGTLFSIGHGGVVTFIALGVGLISTRVAIPARLAEIAGWLPVVLLLCVGALNLQALLRRGDYHAVGWRTWLLPRGFRESSHPAAVVGVGMLFALMFDTATQAAAWGYVATTAGGLGGALLIGLVFTGGMVVTDTLDSRLVASMLRRAERERAQRFRRALGWVIVAMSFGVAGYGIATRIDPRFELGELAYSAVGCALVAIVAVAYGLMAWRLRTR